MTGVEVQELWAAIERDVRAQAGEGYVLRRASIQCHVDLFLGIKSPENLKALVMRVPSDALPEPKALPETRGLRVLVERLRDDPEGSASIIVQLREPTFAEVFLLFSTILVNRTCSARSPMRAAGELLAQLVQWQRFLDARSDGLSEEEQRGLYGELCVLRRLMQETGRVALVEGWVGPSGAPQDFRFGRSCGIEVKTSISGEPQSVRINGERQLDDSNLDSLYLACLSIDRRSGAGETLPELVASLRRSLDGHALELNRFEGALLEYGYLNQHEHRYRSYGLSIRIQRFYRVRDEFPRIVESGLPNAIGQVAYKLALAGCASYAASFEDIVRSLGAIAPTQP